MLLHLLSGDNFRVKSPRYELRLCSRCPSTAPAVGRCQLLKRHLNFWQRSLSEAHRGVCDYRERVLAPGKTKRLTVTEYWLNTQRHAFGIHSLTVTQNESPAYFYKKILTGFETEHIQVFLGRNSVTVLSLIKLSVGGLLRGACTQHLL